MAAPILVMLAVTMFEYGMAFRQENILENAVMSAARTDSQLSKNRLADYEALQQLSSAFGGLKRATVTKISIWKANSNNTVPAACKTSSQPGLCNFYTKAQMNTNTPVGFPGGSFGSPSCAGGWDAAWCPVFRENRDVVGADWLGVWVEIQYTSFTNLIPGMTLTMSEQAIYRLEPPFIGG
ncbi:MAG: pilus assembly protein [Actinobacteria bacterium]|nr:pilus assembly protein [Actinomycetota bacterium]